MKHNYFMFGNKFFQQKHRITIGAKTAPSFANIFMGPLEQSFFDQLEESMRPLFYYCFTDDGFIIWIHRLAAFEQFKSKLNSLYKTIKFDATHSLSIVNFWTQLFTWTM